MAKEGRVAHLVIKEKLKRGIAYYPLTFYFGIVITGTALLLIILATNLGWQLTWEELRLTINDNLFTILLWLTFLLGVVLTSSALAYRQIINLPKEDYYLWLEQRATKTFFPWFAPLHDWLRLRNVAYRRWHTFSFSGPIHFLVFIVFTVVVVSNTTYHAQRLLVAGPPGDGNPPPYAPTMNAASDITTTSIRWNIVDTNTNETAHTFNRTDDTEVASVASTTTATIGTAYSYNETGLSPDTSYTRHAHATNIDGQGPASTTATDRTLANPPGTPTLSGITTSSMTVTTNPNGNPVSTELAIQETNSGNFVQSNGGLAAGTVWQTYSAWGGASGKVVTGLAVNQSYIFRAKARNGSGIETSYSGSATNATLANTPNGPTLTVVSTTSLKIKINENNNPASTQFVIFNNTAGKYVHKNGKLNNSPQWNTKNNYGGDSGVINTDLTTSTDYTYTVKARNSENVETPYSTSATINTGSPPGSTVTPPPTITPPPSGGGTDNPPPTVQLSVTIDILGVNPDTGTYSVAVKQTVDNRLLAGQLIGTIVGGAITGQFSGQFATVAVTGVFTGTVQSGALAAANLALSGSADPTYQETLLVAGVVTNTANQPVSGVGRTAQPLKAVDKANVAVSGLALAATVITSPALSSLIITNSASAAAQSFPWSFFGYIPRRRRRVWGHILDVRTHLPVPGVKVELINLRDNKPLDIILTDRTGRYGFVVEEVGSYIVKVRNPLYFDYQSESITITDPDREIVGQDLYLKPNEEGMRQRVIETAKLIEFFKAMTYLHWPLLVGGSALSLYLELTEPSSLRGVIVGLYFICWLFELNRLNKKRPYGVVVEHSTTVPQELAVVQLTKPKAAMSAIVSTTITDKHGRFFFIVKKGEYNLIATKGGFAPAEATFTGESPSFTLALQRQEK